MAWARLCDELERWGSFAHFAELEQDLRRVLEHWPYELCVAPRRWVELLLQGEMPLGISLVKTLEFKQEVSDAIWLKLVSHPALAHLTCLKLNGMTLDAPRARQLARSSTLTRLRRLDLEHTSFSTEALVQLLSPHSTWHHSLRELTLSNCTLDAKCLRMLSCSTLLDGIESLNISKNRLDPLEVKALFEGAKFHNLKRLDLSFNQIGELGLRELLAHGCTPRLSHLDLYANALPARALGALLAQENLVSLTSLSLGLNQFTPSLINHTLPRSPLWHRPRGLAHLNLDFVQTFKPDTFRELSTHGQFETLEHLSLSGCMLDDESIHTLVEHHTLSCLRKLELNLNAISAQGLHSLCSAHLPKLEHCVLSHNAIDAHAVNVLPHASWIPHTHYLDLRSNLFDDAAREHLRTTPSLMLVSSLLL